MVEARVKKSFLRLIGALLPYFVAVAMLGALIVPRLFAERGPGTRMARSVSDISELSSAADRYRADIGRYPLDSEGLRALLVKPANLPKWNGPYLEKIPLDEWGHAYLYRLVTVKDANGKAAINCEIRSMGPDEKVGGGDDITNLDDSAAGRIAN